MQAQQQEAQHLDDVRAALRGDLEAAHFLSNVPSGNMTPPIRRTAVAAELELRWKRTLECVTNLQERRIANAQHRYRLRRTTLCRSPVT